MTQNEHVYAICCQPEVAGDVISTENEKTMKGDAVLNFKVALTLTISDILLKSFRDGGGGGVDIHRQ